MYYRPTPDQTNSSLGLFRNELGNADWYYRLARSYL